MAHEPDLLERLEVAVDRRHVHVAPAIRSAVSGSSVAYSASSTSRRAVESRSPRERTTAAAASRSGASTSGTALCGRGIVVATANACSCEPTPPSARRQRPPGRSATPPSLGGSRSGTSTRRPAARAGARCARAAGGSGTRRPTARRCRARGRRASRAQSSAVASASAWWKRVGDRADARRRAPTSRAIARIVSPRVEHAGDGGERVGAALGGVARGLELHRRLALVGDLERAGRRARATASNSRPDRGRQRRRRAGLRHPPDGAPALRVDAAAAAARRRPAAISHAHAIRHGSRTAGRRRAAGPATGGRRARSRAGRRPGSRRPRPCRRCPSPAPSKIAPTAGAGLAVLGQAGGQVGVVVLDRDVLDALARERVRGREVVGVQVVRDDLRRDREQPLEVRDALLRTSRASRRS